VDELEQADKMNRLLEDMLAERAPRDIETYSTETLELARVAAQLKPGRAENLVPSTAFVEELGAKLRAMTQPQPSMPAKPAPASARRAPRMPRKRVLGGLVAGASGLLLGGLGGKAMGQAQAEAAWHDELGHPYATPLIGAKNGEWVTVAKAGALKPGDMLRFEAGALLGYLSFDGSSYSAYSAICTHMGCLLHWANSVFLCPCHGSAYQRDGKVLNGVARRPLPTIEVRVLQATGEIQVYTTAVDNTWGTGIDGYAPSP
jgi:Rieske Fe-S protein